MRLSASYKTLLAVCVSTVCLCVPVLAQVQAKIHENNLLEITTDKSNVIVGSIIASDGETITVQQLKGGILVLRRNRVANIARANRDNYDIVCMRLKNGDTTVAEKTFRIEIAEDEYRFVRFTSCQGIALHATDDYGNQLSVSPEVYEDRERIREDRVPPISMRPDFYRIDPGMIMQFGVPAATTLTPWSMYAKTSLLFLPSLLAVGLPGNVTVGYQMAFPGGDKAKQYFVQSLLARHVAWKSAYLDVALQGQWFFPPSPFLEFADVLLMADYHHPNGPSRITIGGGFSKPLDDYPAMPIYVLGFQWQITNGVTILLGFKGGKNNGLLLLDHGIRFFADNFVFELGTSWQVINDPSTRAGGVPGIPAVMGIGYRID